MNFNRARWLTLFCCSIFVKSLLDRPVLPRERGSFVISNLHYWYAMVRRAVVFQSKTSKKIKYNEFSQKSIWLLAISIVSVLYVIKSSEIYYIWNESASGLYKSFEYSKGHSKVQKVKGSITPNDSIFPHSLQYSHRSLEFDLLNSLYVCFNFTPRKSVEVDITLLQNMQRIRSILTIRNWNYEIAAPGR